MLSGYREILTMIFVKTPSSISQLFATDSIVHASELDIYSRRVTNAGRT